MATPDFGFRWSNDSSSKNPKNSVDDTRARVANNHPSAKMGKSAVTAVTYPLVAFVGPTPHGRCARRVLPSTATGSRVAWPASGPAGIVPQDHTDQKVV